MKNMELQLEQAKKENEELRMRFQECLETLDAICNGAPVAAGDSLQDMPVCCMAVTDLTEQKHHEEILAEERLSRSIIEQTAGAIIVCDDRGIVLRASNAAFDLAGRNCLNEPFDEVFRIHINTSSRQLPDKGAEFELFNIDHLIGGKSFLSHEAVIRKDGAEDIYLMLSAVPLLDDSGRVTGGVINLADISEKTMFERQLKESEERFKAIFQGSKDAIFIIAPNAGFAYVNQAACELTGYSEQELHAMQIPDLYAPEDLHAYNRFFSKIMNGEAIVSEARIRRKDGIKVPTEFSNTRVTIGGTFYMHTVARDITMRNKAEQGVTRPSRRCGKARKNTGPFLKLSRKGTLKSTLQETLLFIMMQCVKSWAIPGMN
ncbi:MAG: PAS domain S-box protein [Desulfobacteraceae bacterium]|nr:PAS domain S-box protein [Desulfobacteraceae bacterium]